MRDESRRIRSSAADALLRIGEPAIPGLINALRDESGTVRQSAAVILRMIGTPEALNAVKKYAIGRVHRRSVY